MERCYLPPDGSAGALSIFADGATINAAHALEKAWTKRQILEAYLNLSTFRGELQGVGAASRALFGKQPSGLNEHEALLLAVLLRGPNATAESVAKRACALGSAMQPPQSCDGMDNLAHEALEGASNPRPAVALAPHVARMLVTAEQRRVQSTLDGGLQAFVLDAVNRQLATLDEQHVGTVDTLTDEDQDGRLASTLVGRQESTELLRLHLPRSGSAGRTHEVRRNVGGRVRRSTR